MGKVRQLNFYPRYDGNKWSCAHAALAGLQEHILRRGEEQGSGLLKL